MDTTLIGLYAETPIHAGTGKSVGVIDLPIMREAHTGWPCVYGSAMKGALRAHAVREGNAHVTEIFGPDRLNAADHAGSLLVGDARLLLLPIRSLTSHFKWVACPALLRRAAADARRMGCPLPELAEPPRLTEAQAAMPRSGDQPLYLEEFRFEPTTVELGDTVKALSAFMSGDAEFTERLQEQLVLVSDDMFAHLAQYGTPVTPHIAIDNRTKTVTNGALWYEEVLPADTVLYLPLAAQPSRGKSGMDAGAVMQATLDMFGSKPWLQVGGNETVGMGWCRVTRFGRGASA